MAQYVIENEELNNLNTDNLFGIKTIIDFIFDKYKQILLLILAFIIIYVVVYLTYYNALFYGLDSSVPGVQPQQPNKIKSNTFKKNPKKNKK